jgi:hypothetical protein
MSAKHLFERQYQRRPLFELGRVVRPQHPAKKAAGVAEVEAQESEAVASAKVDGAALLIIDCQFFRI